MLPKVHPLAKTSTQLRHSIYRLESFRDVHAEDALVQDGTVEQIIQLLRNARRAIPKQYQDVDLIENRQ